MHENIERKKMHCFFNEKKLSFYRRSLNSEWCLAFFCKTLHFSVLLVGQYFLFTPKKRKKIWKLKKKEEKIPLCTLQCKGNALFFLHSSPIALTSTLPVGGCVFVGNGLLLSKSAFLFQPFLKNSLCLFSSFVSTITLDPFFLLYNLLLLR